LDGSKVTQRRQSSFGAKWQVFWSFAAQICAIVQLAIRVEPGRIYGDKEMSKCVFAVAVLAGTLSTAAFAGPVTQEESQYCAYDYRQYCNQDGLGSQLLALCMKDHGKELSPECIKALEDAGEVTPEEKADLKKIGE
jgi:hypothetical protein